MQPDSAEETIQRLTFSLSELEQLGEAILTGGGNFNVSSKTYLRVILGTLGVTKGAIFSFDAAESHLVIESEINLNNESLVIPVASDEISIIRGSSIIEISQPPHLLEPLFNSIRPQLQNLDAQLWAPLKIRDELLGVISLGPFLSGMRMESWARGVLSVLANQTSIAMAYSRLMDEMRADKFHLFLLSDITTQIYKQLNTERLEEEIISHAVTLLDANAGYLFLTDPFTRQLELKSSLYLNPASDSGLTANLNEIGELSSHAMISDVAAGGRTLVCNDEKTAAPFGRANLIATPIFGREENLGVLVVCDKEDRGGVARKLTSEDRILLEAFSNQSGVIVENARLYQEALERRRMQAEMEEAEKIQRNLLPDAPPEIAGYELAGISIPRGGVGGDYYDYIREPNGRWGLAIADVSGKGMQAALLMATLRAGLLSEVARRNDLPSMAITLNSLLYESSTLGKFATFFYAQLNPETGELTTMNAGHNYPVVVRSDGSTERLTVGGVMLGMFPDDMIHQISTYEQETIKLDNGDIVLFYTDGVTETFNINKELFGEKRLEHLVSRIHHRDAKEICGSIHNAVLEFQGEARQFDDLTLMVLKKT
ncbi:MAG: SpoIIE family protein phosphatase [Candidatus Poribacteria bacterium]|nr:SpoIIE family protein phosphatase [Candidatus Poribacteria bacterium]